MASYSDSSIANPTPSGGGINVDREHNAGTGFSEAHDLRLPLDNEDRSALNAGEIALRAAMGEPSFDNFAGVMGRAECANGVSVQSVDSPRIVWASLPERQSRLTHEATMLR